MTRQYKYSAKRLLVFKQFAISLASLSKCKERKVAALICDYGLQQVHSIGINGGPKGLVDCMCEIDSKYGCIHAEINALVKDKSTEYNQKVMIVTLAPCNACAAAIINSSTIFAAVLYCEKWKDDSGINLLKNAGIHVECIGN